MRSLTSLSATAIVALVFAANPVSAETITYADLATWQAAVGDPLTTITFDENDSGGFTYHGFAPAVFGGVVFESSVSLFTVDPGYASSGYSEIGSDDVLSFQTYNTGSALNLSILGLNATALAFHWENWDTGLLYLQLSNGDSLPLTTSSFEPGFIGLISTVPITGLTIAELSGCSACVVNIDNFTFNDIDAFNINELAAETAVPEPASLLLLATGLSAAGLRRLKRRGVRSPKV